MGGGSTKGASTVTYAQRVISIPPKASYDLNAMYMFGTDDMEISKGLWYSPVTNLFQYVKRLRLDYKKGEFKNGNRYAFTEDNTPINISTIVAYSFTENCTNERVMSANVYLKELIGINYNKWNLKLKGNLDIPSNVIWVAAKAEDSKDGGFQFPQ